MEIFSSFSGSDFLNFYGVLLFTAGIAGLFIPVLMRPEGRGGELSDMEDIAVMAGGSERHASVITADLLARGGLSEDGKDKLTVRNPRLETGQAGAAVLRMDGSFKFDKITKTLKAHAERVEANLIRRGLLLDGGQRMQLRLLATAPYLLLLAIGLYRWQAGAAAGQPTGFLVTLLIVTGVLALIRFATVKRRTKAGDAAIDRLRERSDRLRRAPTAPEVGIAVALFGTAVLVGTPFETLHAMRQAQGGDGGSSSGDSSSDGGGGCGGGGCGGCGG
jgi:uncharacterized protein (TIGR04222 family)